MRLFQQLVADSITTQAPIAHAQELRKYLGEALREPIRWDCHPAWTIHALRVQEFTEEMTGDPPRKPPPLVTAADIRRLIIGKAA